MASSFTYMTQSLGRAGRLYAQASLKRQFFSSPAYQLRSHSRTFNSQTPLCKSQQHQLLNGVQSSRFFSTTSTKSAKTVQQMKSRQRTGPFSWKAALLFVLTGAGMIIYFRVEKARLERKRITEMSKGVGKPKVGGPFVLKDLDGKEFTDENLKGKYSFVSCLPRLSLRLFKLMKCF